MSATTKAKAHDVIWGRQGGRRVPGDPAGLIVELDKIRVQAKRDGVWPTEPDGPCKEFGCPFRLGEHELCRVCSGYVQHHREELCWMGKARQALARARSGAPLTIVDHEALVRYPDPPSCWVRAAA